MLEIQTTNKQKGFHLAEWLLRPGTRVFAGGFSSTPLYATNIPSIIFYNMQQ